MKRTHLLATSFSVCMLILSGCASYKAEPLDTVSSQSTRSPEQNVNVTISAKAFNKHDCKKYLDRDVISKGYQPVQLTIENNSDQDYYFSLNRIDLQCARPEEVANRVHTSTIGRILGYGIPGLLVLSPLVIPAIVDGIKSSKANDALDSDFYSKTASDQTIAPHSHFNKLIFVPTKNYRSLFNVSLMNQASNQVESFDVAVK